MRLRHRMTREIAQLLDWNQNTALRELISTLAQNAKRERPKQSRMASLLSEGNLAGQKSATDDLDALLEVGASDIDVEATIVALRTLYVFLVKITAVWALAGDKWPRDFTQLSTDDVRRRVTGLVDGTTYREHGVRDSDESAAFSWFADSIDNALSEKLRLLVRAMVEHNWMAGARSAPDPFQLLYPKLVPRNVLHCNGEFYTPYWMADLLIGDTGWAPGQTLVDPFCGSGVFLLAALNRGAKEGHSKSGLLKQLQGIERSPAAAAATKANLILALTSEAGITAETVLPVRCADSIVEVSQFRRDLFDPVEGIEPAKFDVMATNPPWVGWEYIPKPYRATLAPLWDYYELFVSEGRTATFLKEDLSIVATQAAWDKFLKPGGRSAVVLRTATMKSSLAGRRFRRLSIFPGREPLNVTRIREFAFKSFAAAAVEACVWVVEKGRPTTFPIPTTRWKAANGSTLDSNSSLTAIEQSVEVTHLQASRTLPSDETSTWIVESAEHHSDSGKLHGTCPYRGRVGVFTGGANAVFYVEPDPTAPGWYTNVTERAKRACAAQRMQLEPGVVFSLIRGRDLGLWTCSVSAKIICPHTAQTKMKPLPADELMRLYPLTYEYFAANKEFLVTRQGFTAFDRGILEENFYTLQRVGDYTFAPYKVCWKFISKKFETAVVGPAPDGKPILPNDKVMYVSAATAEEAYYVCAMFSAGPFRRSVEGSTVGTQMSTTAISHLAIPRFDASNVDHLALSDICKSGHEAAAAGGSIEETLRLIDAVVKRMLHLN